MPLTAPVRRALLPATIALVLVTASFFAHEHIGLNLADEGYLWYGAVHTADGQVPIRDFDAYDPGRYYWIAAWMPLTGRGPLGLRRAVWLFASIGLACGLIAARRATRSAAALWGVGVLLVLWMFPRHKLVEHAIELAAIYVGVLLLERPSLRRHFAAGVFTGVAAFLGRNHGLYNVVVFAALFLVIHTAGRLAAWARDGAAFCAGVAAGFSPMGILAVLHSGFAAGFIDAVRMNVARGVTNLPADAPLPWRVSYAGANAWTALSQLLTGVAFLVPPVLYIAAMLTLIPRLRRRRPLDDSERLLFAASVVGAVYLHHVAVRSDLAHLAQIMAPCVVATIAAAAIALTRGRRFAAAAIVFTLAVITAGAALPANPLVQLVRARSGDDPYVRYPVRGDVLWIPSSMAVNLDRVVASVRERVPEQASLFIAPAMPGLYVVLGRTSPVMQTYFAWPRGLPEEQRRIVGELVRGDVRWILLADTALDGRDGLRFRNRYHDVWRFVASQYAVVEEIPPDQRLLRRKSLP